jgi:protein involved in polysaccharide export with SLBB domain
VYQPSTIPLKDKDITVSRAIAMAGGPQRDSSTDKIRLIRQSGKGDKVEMVVNLKAIERRQAPDIVLIPNDIIDVPSSTGKRLLNALTGAIAPTIMNTTVRAIP